MKYLILCIFSLFVITANAQNNIANVFFQGSLSLKGNQINDIGETFQKKNKSGGLPQFQYIHFIKKEFGIGGLLSYQQSKYNESNFRNFNGSFKNQIATYKQNYLLFGVSIHERTTFNKYTILNSIEIPFEYYYHTRIDASQYYYYNKTDPIPYDSIIEHTILRKNITTGLHYNLKIYRKLYKGLNAHVGINSGIDCEIPFGNSSHYVYDPTANIVTTITYNTKKSYNIKFGIQPLFGLSYFF